MGRGGRLLFPCNRHYRTDDARHPAVTDVFNGGALILAVTIKQFTCGRDATDIG